MILLPQSKLFIEKKYRDEIVDLGLVSTRVVTTAFFELLVDAMQSDTDLSLFKWHDSGTGTTAAVVGDTGLETKVETGRAEGNQGEVSSVTYRSYAEISYTAARDITEHAIFSAESGGILLDRSVFDPVSVTAGTSLGFTYAFSPGGIAADICVDLTNTLALAEQLNQYIRTLAPALFALGIDTKKSDIFQQELYNLNTKLSNLDTEDGDQARRNKDFYERRYRSPR